MSKYRDLLQRRLIETFNGEDPVVEDSPPIIVPKSTEEPWTFYLNGTFIAYIMVHTFWCTIDQGVGERDFSWVRVEPKRYEITFDIEYSSFVTTAMDAISRLPGYSLFRFNLNAGTYIELKGYIKSVGFKISPHFLNVSLVGNEMCSNV